MREIKFRAWDGEFMNYEIIGILDGIIYGVKADKEGIKCGFEGNAKYYKIMQYTGLKDENGKEVYEGDVIQDRHYYLHEVCFYSGAFGAWSVHYLGKNCPFKRQDFKGLINFKKKSLKGFFGIGNGAYLIEFKVIGNIYENPELLEAK